MRQLLTDGSPRYIGSLLGASCTRRGRGLPCSLPAAAPPARLALGNSAAFGSGAISPVSRRRAAGPGHGVRPPGRRRRRALPRQPRRSSRAGGRRGQRRQLGSTSAWLRHPAQRASHQHRPDDRHYSNTHPTNRSPYASTSIMLRESSRGTCAQPGVDGPRVAVVHCTYGTPLIVRCGALCRA